MCRFLLVLRKEDFMEDYLHTCMKKYVGSTESQEREKHENKHEKSK